VLFGRLRAVAGENSSANGGAMLLGVVAPSKAASLRSLHLMPSDFLEQL
jgi:hypothetical protein